jgi:hypothetical protein
VFWQAGQVETGVFLRATIIIRTNLEVSFSGKKPPDYAWLELTGHPELQGCLALRSVL